MPELPLQSRAMSSGPAKVSAIVTSFNEIDQIEECVASLLWADEVVLVDSFSSDGTVDLVREKFPTVRVLQREYFGSAAQKNFAVDNAVNDWVLIADADERVTPELKNEVRRVMENPKFWAYSIGRRNFILGREVRYSGLQRDTVRRLFNRNHARYPNRRVHTDLAVEGAVGKLKFKFLHNYIRSFDHMIEKMTRYGVWGGTQLFLEQRETNAYQIFGHAFARFFRDYVLNLGFLDGTQGLICVGMHTFYTFWKYAKLWEFTELKRTGSPIALPALEPEEERWKMPWEADEEAELANEHRSI
jgi:glycosyltransferase involved in cell wall biosynthesis